MFFKNNIPDPHLGFYSKNVLGDDARNGEVSVATLNGTETDFVYDSWFYGYYLNGPSNNSPQTQGYLNNVSEDFIFLGAINTGSSPKAGWVFSTTAGWMYLSITPFAFDDTKKKLWVFIDGILGWFLFDRYYCVKDYRLGLDNTDFETFTTSNTYYWMRQVLSYSFDGMTAGEGIVSWSSISGGSYDYILLKPYRIDNINHLRAYYGNNSSIGSADLW